MNNHEKQLWECWERRDLVRVKRQKLVADESVQGFVVGISRDLVVLHAINDRIQLDGYSTLRITDISHLETVDDRHRDFYQRVLDARNERPTEPPEITFETFPSLVLTASAQFSLLTIYLEEYDPEICFIGVPSVIDMDGFDFRKVTTWGTWETDFDRITFTDITRVDFGAIYEAALALSSGAPPGVPRVMPGSSH